PSNGDRYKFTGREKDEETGLQLHGERYYDAKTGRWLSEDPAGFDAGDPNLYRYVGNNATNATDPSGLEVFLHGSSKRNSEAVQKLVAPLPEGIYASVVDSSSEAGSAPRRAFIDFNGTKPETLATIAANLKESNPKLADVLSAAQSRDKHVLITFDDQGNL